MIHPPWAILPRKFSDDSTEPFAKDSYEDLSTASGPRSIGTGPSTLEGRREAAVHEYLYGMDRRPKTTRLRMPPTSVHSAAPARPRAAAPRPRPDRPEVRAAAERRRFMDVVDE
jgi:hypothetical protein